MPWVKGQSGNPHGRKKTSEQKEFEMKCRVALKNHGFDFLLGLLIKGTPEHKIKAVEILLDRGFGKAEQVNHNENINVNEMAGLTDEELINKIKEYSSGAICGTISDSKASGGDVGLPATA